MYRKNVMSKFKSNTEIITDIMEFSAAGPMSQMFIIEAIRKYGEQIIDDQDKINDLTSTSYIGPNGFIDGEAWVHTAKTVLNEISEGYGYKKDY